MTRAIGPSKLNIAFAGTPDFAVPALQGMIDEGYGPKVVLTQPDRRAGRGRTLRPSPVKQRAQTAGIDVWQPERLSGENIQQDLLSLELDLMVVVAYGLILPDKVLNAPRYGCWNIHASLLPRWRGAAPIQRAIEAGDEQTGVSIMQMAAGLDTGPVYLQAVTNISPNETGGSLHDRLAELGTAALLDCLDHLAAGNMPEPLAQDDKHTTYASKLDKSEAQINWQRPALEIERQVRAFDPWPVCWFELNEQRIRVWQAKHLPGSSPDTRQPGSIISTDADGIAIETGDGVLLLTEIQAAGGRRMSAGEYLNAHKVQASG